MITNLIKSIVGQKYSYYNKTTLHREVMDYAHDRRSYYHFLERLSRLINKSRLIVLRHLNNCLNLPFLPRFSDCRDCFRRFRISS